MRLSIEFASVLLSLVLFVPDVHAEANPPPIIVHSSETATDNASPTVTIPQQGNPLTSFTEGPQSHTGRPVGMSIPDTVVMRPGIGSLLTPRRPGERTFEQITASWRELMARNPNSQQVPTN